LQNEINLATSRKPQVSSHCWRPTTRGYGGTNASPVKAALAAKLAS
jgi:hypothetical protein